jgi:hypothetical protein
MGHYPGSLSKLSLEQKLILAGRRTTDLITAITILEYSERISFFRQFELQATSCDTVWHKNFEGSSNVEYEEAQQRRHSFQGAF